MDNFLLVSSVCPKEGKLSTIFDRRAAGWTYGHMATKLLGWIYNQFFYLQGCARAHGTPLFWRVRLTVSGI